MKVFILSMSAFFQVIFYQPIFNLFVGLYDIIPDVGIVILVITLIIKAILWPLTGKGIAAQKSLQELQPKLEEAKKQYKDNPQELAQETLKIYKEHKVNPFGSCLPILIQIPVFLALFWVLQKGLGGDISGQLYSFVPRPESINPISLGLFDLAKPSIVLALLAGLSQWYQAKTMITRRPKPVTPGAKDEDLMAMMNKQMLYMLPVMTALIGMTLPGGVSLYWFFSTVITALQQHLLIKKTPTEMPAVIEGEIIEKK
jgi:YidC/Oxa1 family membrane protein insertase